MRIIIGLAVLLLVATPVTAAFTVYRGPLTNPFTGQEGRLTARVRTTGTQLTARLRCRGACVVRRGRIAATYDAAASSVVGTLRDTARLSLPAVLPGRRRLRARTDPAAPGHDRDLLPRATLSRGERVQWGRADMASAFLISFPSRSADAETSC